MRDPATGSKTAFIFTRHVVPNGIAASLIVSAIAHCAGTQDRVAELWGSQFLAFVAFAAVVFAVLLPITIAMGAREWRRRTAGTAAPPVGKSTEET